VPDAVWYRSLTYNEYRRAAGADHALTSVYEVSAAGGVSVVCLQRTVAERDFSPREQRLLNFFHAELGPLVGHALVSATEPGSERLSPRLRQTLVCLLEGDSEKQVAARLGLSQATTHQYVTMLYRRFGVRSRAQLLVHVLRRVGNGRAPPVAVTTCRREPTAVPVHGELSERMT
jgi:DNA-binding NarL/FixJ family response regulator